MHTSSYGFIAAAAFAAVSQGAGVLGEMSGGKSDLFAAIQYGGTGGLVIALLFAVRALWADRAKEREEHKADRSEMLKQLTAERAIHRQELDALREQGRHDLEEQTNRFIAELQRQITEERTISDRKYQQDKSRGV